MTGPLERLPTYLSHRGSGPNVVRTKILKNEFFFWNHSFFFFEKEFNVEWGFLKLKINKKNLSFFKKKNEQKEIIWTTSFLQSWCLKVNLIPLARKDLKSLNICNQICFFILKIFRLSLQRQSKKWNAWESRMLGTSKKGKIPSLKDFKVFIQTL